MAVKLSLENLGELDNGIAEEMINQALQTAMRDVDDRGEDGAARTVTIDVVMKKNLKAVGKPVEIFAKCQTKLPPTQTGGVLTLARRNGQQVDLLFQPSNPEAPDQPTFFDKEQEED